MVQSWYNSPRHSLEALLFITIQYLTFLQKLDNLDIGGSSMESSDDEVRGTNSFKQVLSILAIVHTTMNNN